MAIEQPTPEVARTDRIELEAPTEAELCTRGAVKLTHIDLAQLKTAHGALQVELRTEKQRTEASNIRAISAEAECRVLRDTLRLTGRREIIVRLIELVIIGLVNYAIEAAKSGNRVDLAVFILASLVLVAVIALIQWWPRPPERK